MKKFTKFLIIFTIGSVFYCFLEIAWRGFTHPTMLITGGICLMIAYAFNTKFKQINFIYRTIIISLIIISMEFVVGCIVNLLLKWNVWDYSNAPYNLLGQICFYFYIIWLFLSVFILIICNFLRKIFEKFEFI